MKKPKRHYDEVNYWESMADSMVGLLLCVLLVILLLVLYLVQVPEETYIDKEMGNSYELYDDAEAGGGNHSYGENMDDPGNQWNSDAADNTGEESGGASSGGAGGGGGEDDESFLYEDPDPGAGEGDGTDKAAVLVQLVDGETSRTIKKSGIEFELYGSDSSLKVLSTYYPKKVDYSSYATDENGVFYLPERIPLLTYSLQELTTVAGYDIAENTEFTIDKSYEWSTPYIVTVSINPSKNIIRMNLKDRDDGKAVSGATFQVIAAQNIVTQDGTTRYKEGDVADVITIDDAGYGESVELYLGEYLLRQEKVPQFYGKNTEDHEVSIQSKSEVSTPAITEVYIEKTAVEVTLKDALYDTVYLEGSKFTLTQDDGTVVDEFTTDEKGKIELFNLKKNKTYHIRQKSSIGEYQLDPGDYSFTVNGDGLIDGAAKKEITITNRLIRIALSVRDKLFKGQLSDVNMAVYDAEGTVIATWDSTGLEKVLEGVEPGEYNVILAGDEKNAQTITVEDKTDLQKFEFEQWTPSDIGAILALAVFGVGFVVALRWILRRRREKKQEGEE